MRRTVETANAEVLARDCDCGGPQCRVRLEDGVYTKALEAIRTGDLAEVEKLVKAGILPPVALAVLVAQATGVTP